MTKNDNCKEEKGFLSNTEKDIIPILLGFRQVLLKIEFDIENISDALIDYLIVKYTFEKEDLKNISRKKKQTKNNGLEKTKVPEKWRNFINGERKIITEIINEDKYEKFNYLSAKELITVTENAEKCIYFNTYIKSSEWNSPILQMYLCLQKGIEHTINLKNIKLAINKLVDDKAYTADCHSCKPKYKHFRITFLPFTEKEINKKLITEESFKENLKFTVLMHNALSIQLAFVNLNQFLKIILENKGLFVNDDFLKQIGINNEIKFKIINDERDEIIEMLKSSIKKMGIPLYKNINNFDFLYIKNNNTDKDTLLNNIWGGYYDKDEGLTLYNNTDEINKSIKKQFAEIFIKKLISNNESNGHSFRFLDAISRFYNNELNDLDVFKSEYNALEIVENYLTKK